MKTVLFFLCIGFSFLSQAQSPLLPLLKNSSRWQIIGREMGGFFNQGINHELSYSIHKDTVIKGKNYTFLIRRYESRDICIQTPCPIQVGRSGTDTLLVGQFGNAIVTSKNDTLFSMSGTTVGDSVRLNYQYSRLWASSQPEYLKITNIENVSLGSETIRLFSFGHKQLSIHLFYLDGVGFNTGGPLPENGYYELAERMSYLTCYQLENSSYLTSWNPVAIVPSSSACNIILSTSGQEFNSATKIYVNESNELVHDLVANQIEIVNSIGQHVLSNQNASKTNLTHLKSGVYVARLVIGTQTKSYRFMIR